MKRPCLVATLVISRCGFPLQPALEDFGDGGAGGHCSEDYLWANYSDRKHEFSPQKVAIRKGNPIISGKSRLVKYYNFGQTTCRLSVFGHQAVQKCLLHFFYQKK